MFHLNFFFYIYIFPPLFPWSKCLWTTGLYSKFFAEQIIYFSPSFAFSLSSSTSALPFSLSCLWKEACSKLSSALLQATLQTSQKMSTSCCCCCCCNRKILHSNQQKKHRFLLEQAEVSSEAKCDCYVKLNCRSFQCVFVFFCRFFFFFFGGWMFHGVRLRCCWVCVSSNQGSCSRSDHIQECV